MKNVFKWGAIAAGALAASALALMAWIWFSTYDPPGVQKEPVVCPKGAPPLHRGRKIKVLSWNVQFMAGKRYVFFYDLPDESGPHERPSREEIEATLREVVRVIIDERPDIVLLQEVDDGARRTDYEDQLARLLSMMPADYPCHASAFYWKASFVPHPRIMGAAGMKLSILSRFRMISAVRHALPQMPAGEVRRRFMLKRAVLEVRMPLREGGEVAVLNTHLDAFAQGTDTMERQVESVMSILEGLDGRGIPWIIGGDFNLLAPGKAWSLLDERQRRLYRKETELTPLFKRYSGVPGPDEVNGPEPEIWFTHFPNDLEARGPDRTIDYIFMADALRLGKGRVRRHDTLKISDHLPVIAEIEMP